MQEDVLAGGRVSDAVERDWLQSESTSFSTILWKVVPHSELVFLLAKTGLWIYLVKY